MNFNRQQLFVAFTMTCTILGGLISVSAQAASCTDKSPEVMMELLSTNLASRQDQWNLDMPGQAVYEGISDLISELGISKFGDLTPEEIQNGFVSKIDFIDSDHPGRNQSILRLDCNLPDDQLAFSVAKFWSSLASQRRYEIAMQGKSISPNNPSLAAFSERLKELGDLRQGYLELFKNPDLSEEQKAKIKADFKANLDEQKYKDMMIVDNLFRIYHETRMHLIEVRLTSPAESLDNTITRIFNAIKDTVPPESLDFTKNIVMQTVKFENWSEDDVKYPNFNRYHTFWQLAEETFNVTAVYATARSAIEALEASVVPPSAPTEQETGAEEVSPAGAEPIDI